MRRILLAALILMPVAARAAGPVNLFPSFSFAPADACPAQVSADVAALPKGAPSAADLQKLLGDIQKDYAQREGQQGMQSLNQALMKLPDNATVANGGAALYMAGNTVAAVYTLALAASKSADPLTLANLGAALNQAKDYARAVQVLRYAAVLKPQAPLILSNLGVAYVQAGDFKDAESYLKQSLQYNPKQVEANYALGKLYQCQKDSTKALAAFQASLSAGYTTRATTAVTAITGKAAPTLDALPAASQGGDAGASSGFGDSFGGSHADESFDVTEAHVPATPQDYLIGQQAEAITKADEGIAMHATDLENQAEAIGHDGVHNIPYGGSTGKQMSLLAPLKDPPGTHTYWSQNDEAPRMAMLHLYNNTWHDTFGKEATDYEDQVQGFDDLYNKTQEQADATYQSCIAVARSQAAAEACIKALCGTVVPASQQAYENSKSAYYAYHARVAKNIQQFYKDAAKYQDRMTDPDDFDALDLWRQASAMQATADVYTPHLAGVAANVVWKSSCENLTRGSDGDQPGGKDGKKGQPAPCNFKLGFSIGDLLSFKADCTKMSISGGELVKGRLDFDARSKVATVFVGVGVSADANLSAGPVSYKAGSVGAEGGVFTSFDTGGNVTDVGAYGNVSGSIGPMNASSGVQIGIASGVNFT